MKPVSKPRTRTFKVWLEKETVKLLQVDNLSVGFLFDKRSRPFFPDAKRPWRGLIEATLTLKPPPPKRKGAKL